MRKKLFCKKLIHQCMKTICLLLVFCLTLLITWKPSEISASEKPSPNLTIKINDKTYENITSGSKINGDFNPNDLTFWIVSVDGYELENVGNRSDATDFLGRNPLEVAIATQTDHAIVVTLKYHAIDDPVEANREHSFEIVGLTFTNSDNPVIEVPTVSKLSNVKSSGKSKALKISWDKTIADGYKLEYSTSKTFKSAKEIVIANEKTSITIKNLKKSKTYYVRICAYKEYTDGLGNPQTVYGKWVTVKKKTK